MDNQVEPEDSHIQQFTKLLNQNTINYDGDVDSNNVTLISSSTVKNTGKSLSTIYTGMSDAISSKVVAKSLETTASIDETTAVFMDKYLYTEEDPDILPPQDHQGYVQVNSYYGQDYVTFDDEYSVGSRESTYNTL